MEKENKDLLDLCQLNILEDKIDTSIISDQEKKDALVLLDWKRRRLVGKILHKAPVASDDSLVRHIEENTIDGKYIGGE